MRDRDIRVKLKTTVLQKYYADNDSRVVEELSVSYGDARVDIAVINGSIHGFEIKSESDTLNRLPNQIKVYSKTFDYLTVITGENHLQGVLSNIPEWCGVIVATHKKTDGGIKLKTIRLSKRNTKVEKLSLAQLLWKDETIKALVSLGISKGLNNKSKPFLWNLLSDSVSYHELSSIVRKQLKSRANWKSETQPFESGGYSQLSSK